MIDTNPGPANSSASILGALDGALYFTANDGQHGEELWGMAPDPMLNSADLNGDTAIDFADFVILSDNYGKTTERQEDGDIDNDGKVSFTDFLILAASFESKRR